MIPEQDVPEMQEHWEWGNADDSYQHGFEIGFAEGHNAAVAACTRKVKELLKTLPASPELDAIQDQLS